MRKTRRGRLRKGGKYLGKGTYGCTYMPSIRCEGDTHSQSDVVSKYMMYPEAIKEFQKYVVVLSALFDSEDQNIINSFFDPANPLQFEQKLMEFIATRPEIARKVHFVKEHFLFPTNICKPAVQTPQEQMENPFHTCTIRGASHILQMQYGGVDWSNVHAGQVLSILKYLNGLFDAVEFLHIHDIVHMDIKPLNIVSQFLPDGSVKSRLIDYGFLFDTNKYDIYADDLDLFRRDYYIWPYEVRFLDPMFDKSDITKKSIDTFHGLQDAYEMVDPIPSIPKRPPITEDLAKKAIDFLQPRKGMPGLIGKSCDVFALGRAIYSLVKKATDPIPNRDMLIALILDMIDYNYFERISIQDAKSRFAEWVALSFPPVGGKRTYKRRMTRRNVTFQKN